MLITVEDEQELLQTIQESTGYLFVYKHSATCPTAILAKRQVKKALEAYPETPIIYLHVWDQRDLSNLVAEEFNTKHESPQLLMFKEGILKEVKNHHNITTEYILHYTN